MTAMGIRMRQNAECVGVLVPVDEAELARFDVRETGYDRVPIAHQDVERIPYLGDEEHYDHRHSYFNNEAKEQSLPSTVWVYVQQNPLPVSRECPIAQTYVDVILRGCLTISEDFARDFLITTRGWHPKDFDSSIEGNNDYDRDTEEEAKTGEQEVAFWVNDRHHPLYVRADAEFSKRSGPQLDRLLGTHRPELSRRRHFYGRNLTM
jgi:hypothetical protein